MRSRFCSNKVVKSSCATSKKIWLERWSGEEEQKNHTIPPRNERFPELKNNNKSRETQRTLSNNFVYQLFNFPGGSREHQCWRAVAQSDKKKHKSSLANSRFMCMFTYSRPSFFQHSSRTNAGHFIASDCLFGIAQQLQLLFHLLQINFHQSH